MALLGWLTVHIGWWSVGLLESVLIVGLAFGIRALVNRRHRQTHHRSW